MNKLKQVMDTMNYEDLLNVKKDFDSGTFKKILDKKLAIVDINERFCPTCYNPIAEEEEKYRLVFGPPGLRKQAVFDELDCMNHFLNTHIKNMKSKEQELHSNRT